MIINNEEETRFNVCRPFRHGTFRQESFRRRFFIPGTFRHVHRSALQTFRQMDISTQEHFGMGPFRHRNISARGRSAPKHFGTELFRHLGRPATFQHVHVLTRGLFVAGTFRHLYFSAPVLFGTGTFRHWDFLARRLFGTGTFRHWEYLGREFSALGMARFFWCRFLAPFT